MTKPGGPVLLEAGDVLVSERRWPPILVLEVRIGGVTILQDGEILPIASRRETFYNTWYSIGWRKV